MKVIHEPAPAADADADRIALVMLPGAGDRAADLVKHGFVRALRDRRLPVDVFVADARSDYYVEGSIVHRLERDAVGLVRRPARVWLMGISLGGLGALSYARAHGAAIEGLILLAPFLATRGLIAEITRAGGLGNWQPGPTAAEDPERALLEWLTDYRSDDPSLPRIYLGYGTEDRYAAASVLLAGRLPEKRVARIQGGHDWGTWLELWERLLDARVFTGNGASV
jgi:pimeloyl-ACP methyl ester carboxylesterase